MRHVRLRAADEGNEARRAVDDIEPGWSLTQLRLTTRKSRAMLRPAVQVPGTANTSVQRVSIGNMITVQWLAPREQPAPGQDRDSQRNKAYRHSPVRFA